MRLENNFKDIPEGDQYEGYLWYSDAEKPVVYHRGKVPLGHDAFTENAFVVEGWLYDQAQQISYGIRWIDGEYRVHRYALNDSGGEYTEQRYLAHDLGEIAKFNTKTYWQAEADERCGGMEVLTARWTAFAGFVNDQK